MYSNVFYLFYVLEFTSFHSKVTFISRDSTNISAFGTEILYQLCLWWVKISVTH